MQTPRRIGVILAAGRGRRMGGTKQLAVCDTAQGPKPLVAAAYDAICAICDEMIVVLGHEAEAVAAALGERKFHRVDADPDAPMFESVRGGLMAAQSIDPDAAVVLQPGDHPDVAPATLHALKNWSLKRPVRTIIPEYGGQGGHPVLIPAAVVALVVEAQCPEGLGQFWTDHPELCYRLAVDDAGVIRDVDLVRDLEG
jgi:molybdenum cofactor cytidylyltransferase